MMVSAGLSYPNMTLVLHHERSHKTAIATKLCSDLKAEAGYLVGKGGGEKTYSLRLTF